MSDKSAADVSSVPSPPTVHSSRNKNPLLSASVTGITFEDFPNKPLLLPAAPPIVHTKTNIVPGPISNKEAKSLVTVGHSSKLDNEKLDEINLNAVTDDTAPSTTDSNSNSLLEPDNLISSESILSQAASSFSALPTVASSVFSTFSKRLYAGNGSYEHKPQQDQAINAKTLPQLEIQPAFQQQQLPQHFGQTFAPPPPSGDQLYQSADKEPADAFVQPVEPPKFYTPAEVPELSKLGQNTATAAGQNTYRLAAKKKLYAPIPGLSDQVQQPAIASLPYAQPPAPIDIATIGSSSDHSAYPQQPFNQQQQLGSSTYNRPQQEDNRKGGLFSLTTLVPSGVLQNLSGLVQSAAGTFSQSVKSDETVAAQQSIASTSYDSNNYFVGQSQQPQQTSLNSFYKPPAPTSTTATPTPFKSQESQAIAALPSTFNKLDLLSPTSQSIDLLQPQTPQSGFLAGPPVAQQTTITDQPDIVGSPAQAASLRQTNFPAFKVFDLTSQTSSTIDLLRQASSQQLVPPPSTFLDSGSPLTHSPSTSQSSGNTTTVEPTNHYSTSVGPNPIPALANLPPPPPISQPPTTAAPSSFRLQKGTRLYKNPLTSQETAASHVQQVLQPKEYVLTQQQQQSEQKPTSSTVFDPFLAPVFSSPDQGVNKFFTNLPQVPLPQQTTALNPFTNFYTPNYSSSQNVSIAPPPPPPAHSIPQAIPANTWNQAQIELPSCAAPQFEISSNLPSPPQSAINSSEAGTTQPNSAKPVAVAPIEQASVIAQTTFAPQQPIVDLDKSQNIDKFSSNTKDNQTAPTTALKTDIGKPIEESVDERFPDQQNQQEITKPLPPPPTILAAGQTNPYRKGINTAATKSATQQSSAPPVALANFFTPRTNDNNSPARAEINFFNPNTTVPPAHTPSQNSEHINFFSNDQTTAVASTESPIESTQGSNQLAEEYKQQNKATTSKIVSSILPQGYIAQPPLGFENVVAAIEASSLELKPTNIPIDSTAAALSSVANESSTVQAISPTVSTPVLLPLFASEPASAALASVANAPLPPPSATAATIPTVAIEHTENTFSKYFDSVSNLYTTQENQLQEQAQASNLHDPSTFFDSFPGTSTTNLLNYSENNRVGGQTNTTTTTTTTVRNETNEEQQIQNFFNNPPPKENIPQGSGDLNYDLVHSGVAIKNLNPRALTPISNLVEPPSSACSEFSELNNSASNKTGTIGDIKPQEQIGTAGANDTANDSSIEKANENCNEKANEIEAEDLLKHYKDLPEEILQHLRMSSANQNQQLTVPDTPYTPAVKHWFYKRIISEKAQWLPFSHYDSALLETSFLMNEQCPTTVAVEGGRFDVNIQQRIKMPVYWEGKPIEVRRCSWFYKGIDSKYIPYEEDITDLLENEYQQAKLSGEWHRKIMLSMGEQVVFHGPTVLVHFQQAPTADSWGGSSSSTSRPRVVKRDLDDFTIHQGESQRVDHLLLMVHGVGGACDLKMRPVEEVVDDFRSIAMQLVQSHYKNSTDMGLVGRVEVLPISWHSNLHSAELGIDEKLKAITLESIPKLRNFTNDTLLDVLFYTSPTYCQRIMNTVASSLNAVYLKYRERNPDFNGGVSVSGHSLGSLILFDLLSHQEPLKETEEQNFENPDLHFGANIQQLHSTTSHPNLHYIPNITQLYSGSIANSNLQAAGLNPTLSQLESETLRSNRSTMESSEHGYMMGHAGTGQPLVQYGQLVFQPKKLFALGSPIGMFVTIRGIDKLGLDFRLPTCPGFYNIFHPFDPVAYRMEALVNPDMAGIRPVLIAHHKGRKRMHLELRETVSRVGADLKQRFFDTFKTTIESVNLFGGTTSKKDTEEAMRQEVDNALSKIEEQEKLQQQSEHLIENREIGSTMRQRNNSVSTIASESDAIEIDFPLGKLNDSKRIDYVLQEAPLEFFNEYICAFTSHVCYWDSADTILFVMKEIYTGLGITPDNQVPQQTMTIERPLESDTNN